MWRCVKRRWLLMVDMGCVAHVVRFAVWRRDILWISRLNSPDKVCFR